MNNTTPHIGDVVKVIHNFDWPRPDTDTVRPKDVKLFWCKPRYLENIGRLAILKEGSASGGWFIVFLDDGSSCAWYPTGALEFVRRSEQDELEAAEKKFDILMEKKTHLEYYLARYDNGDHTIDMVVFEKIAPIIEVSNPFAKNGEYYALFQSCMNFMPFIEPMLKNTLDDPKIKEDLRVNLKQPVKPETLEWFDRAYENLRVATQKARESELYKQLLEEFKKGELK